MNILVIGANGRVGTALSAYLSKEGHKVYAASRSDKNTKGANITWQMFDLHWEVDTMATAIAPLNIELIYFVAGSRGKDLLQTDAFGAVKTMQMAMRLGIERYILLSSVFALQPERWNEKFLASLTDYNIAKYFADNWLITNTQLKYTILQPGALQEEKGSGTITTHVTEPMSNSIDNVVSVLAYLKEAPNTIGKVITMGDGNISIKEAIDKIS